MGRTMNEDDDTDGWLRLGEAVERALARLTAANDNGARSGEDRPAPRSDHGDTKRRDAFPHTRAGIEE